jgi:hypothetical protein
MANFENLDKVAKENDIGGSSDFLRIKEEGLYRLRIISEYEFLGSFFYPAEYQGVINLGQDKGVFYPGVSDNSENIKVNKSNQFFMHVILRGEEDEEDKIKLFAANWTIMEGIRDLAKDSEYAFDEETGLPTYDIKVRKTIDGPASNPSSHNYGVMPSREDTPLTSDEKEMLANLKPIEEIVQNMKDKEMEHIKNGEYTDIGVKFVSKDGMKDLDEAEDTFSEDDLPEGLL